MRIRLLTLLISVSTLALYDPSVALAQVKGNAGLNSDVVIEGSILEPEKIQVKDDAKLTALIKAPDGFKVDVFARDLINPRMLAVSQRGVLYATRRSVGDVIMLEDEDGDGKADASVTVASRPNMHGIAFDGDTVFLVTIHDVYTADVNEDGTFGPLTRIINDLPDGGQHANRTIGIGPDGMLYISVGSTCNECQETNPENATILRASKDGKSRTIFASGLRNTIGFAWEPGKGALYGVDHGIDWLGDEVQVEELNRIEQGKKYGWPFVYGMSGINPHTIRRKALRSNNGPGSRPSRCSATPRTARRCKWRSITGAPSRQTTGATRSLRCAVRGTAVRPAATRSSASTSKTASPSVLNGSSKAFSSSERTGNTAISVGLRASRSARTAPCLLPTTATVSSTGYRTLKGPRRVRRRPPPSERRRGDARLQDRDRSRRGEERLKRSP